MRLALITDTWYPLTNGVVTTLSLLIPRLEELGHQVKVFHPRMFQTIPVPTYPEIRLAVVWQSRLAKLLDEWQPTALHALTEYSMGMAARSYCLRRNLPFTSSYTTKMDEYIHGRFPFIPKSLIMGFLRWFHSKAVHTTVATKGLADELQAQGFERLVPWGRAVDSQRFRPMDKDLYSFPRPISVYLGRVAEEKNLKAFLELDTPGTKVVIGHGPALPQLKKKYTEAHFLGLLKDEELVRHLAAGDLLVFPSRTDTFGVVMLEAMACGLPVAAYPVVGPLDVVQHGTTGWLDEDLQRAFHQALGMDPENCRKHAMEFTIERCVDDFVAMLCPWA